MKRIYLALYLLVFLTGIFPVHTFAQKHRQAEIDLLKARLAGTKQDTAKLLLLCKLGEAYAPIGQAAMATKYIRDAETIGKNLHLKQAKAKGMLEHSRTSTGQKEATDMNKLVDEYLGLAYHGLRAKDNSFSAELITNLGEGLPLAKVIPQDIGRVMLNLFNNAFYATQQKQKTAGADYKPMLKVSTTLQGKQLLLTVEDNGTGIPDAIKDKIMQPFFTTKPTGQGTGLGLSSVMI